MRRFLLLVPLLAACNTDTAVFVDGTIANPSVTVEDVLLGTKLGGGFVLSLHLGAHASGSSTTNIEGFSLVDAQGLPLLDPLVVTTSSMVSGIDIAQDSTTTIDFAVDPNELATDDELTAVCGAGNVQIRGTFSDSLASGSTPVESGPFAPSGCP
jgi:hypothetical protein